MPSEKAMQLAQEIKNNCVVFGDPHFGTRFREERCSELVDAAITEAVADAMKKQDGYINAKPTDYMSAQWVVGHILWLRNKVARCEINDQTCESLAQKSVLEYGRQCADTAVAECDEKAKAMALEGCAIAIKAKRLKEVLMSVQTELNKLARGMQAAGQEYKSMAVQGALHQANIIGQALAGAEKGGE